MREAVQAVSTRRLDPTPLYTHRFPLEDLAAALNHLRDRDGSFLKALVMYE
jgi:threonine dehydrogenase-like Zn-dependent dehydrogenase